MENLKMEKLVGWESGFMKLEYISVNGIEDRIMDLVRFIGKMLNLMVLFYSIRSMGRVL